MTIKIKVIDYLKEFYFKIENCKFNELTKC